MPTKLQYGSYFNRPPHIKALLWMLCRFLGIIYFAYALLRWLLSAKNITSEAFGLKGAWQEILFVWWSSRDTSDNLMGKTITILEHKPGEYD